MMASYAPPPAEEFTDSEEDDFSFAPPASTSYRYQNTSSNNAQSGGFNRQSTVTLSDDCVMPKIDVNLNV